MSSGPLSSPPVATPADAPQAPRRARSRAGRALGLWARVALAVGLLAASATARHWQSLRVDALLRDGRVAPFPLADLPMTLGDWVGSEEKMDSDIARATGSTDQLFRVYQHRRTGQKVNVIVLFGPSTEMYVHTPENCYPAAGYTQTFGPTWRDVKVGPGQTRPFHALTFVKGEGGQVDRQEVLYTWRYSDQWTPNLVTQKGFERIPGMFKVHVARPIRSESELELLDVESPCEALIAQLIPEIEARLKPKLPPEAGPAPGAKPAPAPAR